MQPLVITTNICKINNVCKLLDAVCAPGAREFPAIKKACERVREATPFQLRLFTETVKLGGFSLKKMAHCTPSNRQFRIADILVFPWGESGQRCVRNPKFKDTSQRSPDRNRSPRSDFSSYCRTDEFKGQVRYSQGETPREIGNSLLLSLRSLEYR